MTFEVAIRQLGGWPILLGSAESRLGERETIPDLARNLSLWVDAIVARVFRHVDLEELAIFATVPVVNALSDWEHPCQALADILTLTDVWSDFDGKKLSTSATGTMFPAPCGRLRTGRILVSAPSVRKATGRAEDENVEWFTEPKPWKAPTRSTPMCGPAWAGRANWRSASRSSGPIRSTRINGEDGQTHILHALPARASRPGSHGLRDRLGLFPRVSPGRQQAARRESYFDIGFGES